MSRHVDAFFYWLGVEKVFERIELFLARREFPMEAGVQDIYARPPLPEWKQKIRNMDERINRRMGR